MTLAPPLFPRPGRAQRTFRTPPVPGMISPHSGSIPIAFTKRARSVSPKISAVCRGKNGVSTTTISVRAISAHPATHKATPPAHETAPIPAAVSPLASQTPAGTPHPSSHHKTASKPPLPRTPSSESTCAVSTPSLPAENTPNDPNELEHALATLPATTANPTRKQRPNPNNPRPKYDPSAPPATKNHPHSGSESETPAPHVSAMEPRQTWRDAPPTAYRCIRTPPVRSRPSVAPASVTWLYPTLLKGWPAPAPRYNTQEHA